MKKANVDYLVPKTYFGWLYKVYEAGTSIEFICILNYYIIGTRISKMFVFNDLSRQLFVAYLKWKEIEKLLII